MRMMKRSQNLIVLHEDMGVIVPTLKNCMTRRYSPASFKMLSVIFCTIICFPLGASAQLSVDGVTGVRCVDSDRDEAQGGTDIYVEGSNMPLDCWRHEHPNGLDRVFIPGVWGNSPGYGSAARRWIKTAYDAISDSRAVYRELDGLSHRAMSVLMAFDLNESDPAIIRDHAAVTLRQPATYGNRCIFAYRGIDVMSLADLRGDDPEVTALILAHEIAHCYQNEYLPATMSTMSWLAESTADFMATLVYPSSNAEHVHVVQYDFAEDFRQAYSSFILFEFARQQSGLEPVWRAIKRLAATTDVQAQYRIVDDFVDFHEYMFQHWRGLIPDTGGCNGVPCNYPKSPLGAIQVESIIIERSAPSPRVLAPIEGGRIQRFRIVAGGGPTKFTFLGYDNPDGTLKLTSHSHQGPSRTMRGLNLGRDH